MEPIELAERLAHNCRLIIEKKKWTQGEFGRAIGMNSANVTRLLSGTRYPTAIILTKIATALQIDPVKLIAPIKKDNQAS